VYPPLANGGFNTGALQKLQLKKPPGGPPAATPRVAHAEFQSRERATVDGTLGNSYPATFYFTQTATPGQWNVDMTVNGTQVGGAQTLTFNSAGTLTAPANGNVAFNGYTPADGATAMNMTFNFGETTQYGTTFGVSNVTQNGYTTGQLSTVSVSTTGVVSAVYTNGRST